ncbi:MAG: 50S ribosomal protein L23 [Halobacteriaceae archaeon]
MSVLEYPIVTEKAMDAMDFENSLQFVVREDATKPEVRDEVEDRYDVGVTSVNTMVTPQGRKKAVVRLDEESDAQDVASRIGVF